MERSRRFVDIVVGEELEPVIVEVTPEMIKSYGEILDDNNPYYAENRDFQGPIGYPSLASILAYQPFNTVFPPEPGGIHTKQEFEFHAPIRPGVKAKVIGKVVDKYEKWGRKYIIFETRIEDEEGKLLVLGKSHSIIPR